jgi:hypothetical protein
MIIRKLGSGSNCYFLRDSLDSKYFERLFIVDNFQFYNKKSILLNIGNFGEKSSKLYAIIAQTT